jgi:hypothetical protein
MQDMERYLRDAIPSIGEALGVAPALELQEAADDGGEPLRGTNGRRRV